MDTYRALKDEILQINRDVRGLFATAKSIPGLEDYSFGEWEKTCEQLPRQLDEDIIRVAIVGTIKSGKSTFLNSIFKGEYVKRGAGVITSIVTRVRNGERLRAKLFFKSWDEINAEMEQALVLFPTGNWRTANSKFDIRQSKDRHELKRALGELNADQLITQSTRNINNVLLTSYLKGYDTVSPLLSEDKPTRLYEDERFSEHKAFVGNESLAVYLKDVLLEINSGKVESNLEIADCQGSDSSNPLHIAMIQDYLLLTHLMIYVISSRTGLRQADIRFLSMIKKMGILENIVFVINCDFSEHDSIEDLNALVNRVREELGMIKPDPDIYSFSALYNLFRSNGVSLSGKDRLRLKQWEADSALAEYSNRESLRFESVFYENLTRKRYALLLQNHIERFGVILTGYREWLGLNREILAKDADSVAGTLRKIKIYQSRFSNIKSTVKKTLAGAAPELKKNLQQYVHRFFDPHAGGVVKNLLNFIREYKPGLDKYQPDNKDANFSQILYLVFQDFKQSIDSHITEEVNPELIRFMQVNEKRIGDYFESLLGPFDTMAEEAYEEFNKLSDRSQLLAEGTNPSPDRALRMEVVVKESGLKPPVLVTAAHYSAGIKIKAFMHLGFYKTVQKYKTMFKKTTGSDGQARTKVLEDAVQRMISETLRSVVYQLKDYRENLKFGYLFQLVDAACESYAQKVLERFQAYFCDLSAILERVGTSQEDQEKAKAIIDEMDRSSRELVEKINRIRRRLTIEY
jgi:GTPase SAR1 family protein